MKIVTDSAADLPPEEIENLGIVVAPLQIQFPDGTVNSEEITRDDFYSRLKAMWPAIPTTSLPPVGYFTDLYRKLAAKKDQILSIHVSSGLSSTIQSARLGAGDVPEAAVEHVDSMTLSGGERFQVIAAALADKAGRSKEYILERLQRIREATETIYTLDTLTYLARGGRIGRVQALAGALLHIKPIIHVDKADGKYSTVGKERTLHKALTAIVDHLQETYGETPLWVSVLHGQFNEQAEVLSEMIKSRLNVAKLEVLRISPVLGVHTGPGIVGAAVVPFGLMEDI